jgi:hypothetical protein
VGEVEHLHTPPEDKSYRRKEGQKYPSGMSTEKKLRYCIAEKASRKLEGSVAKNPVQITIRAEVATT